MEIENLQGREFAGLDVGPVLGKSAGGITFAAARGDSPVALKLLPPKLVGADAEEIALFHRELRTAAELQHVNLVRVLEHGTHKGVRYALLERFEGTPLSALLEGGKTYDLRAGASILRQVFRGCAAAHDAGLVHRNLAPDQILVSDDGAVKVLGFGASKALLEAGGAHWPEFPAENPEFVSPEQVAAAPVTASADVYALGVLAFLLFTGSLPFKDDSPVSLRMLHLMEMPPDPHDRNPDLPVPLTAFILGCLAKEPGLRFPNAAAALRAFDSAVRGTEGEATPEEREEAAPVPAPDAGDIGPGEERPAEEEVSEEDKPVLFEKLLEQIEACLDRGDHSHAFHLLRQAQDVDSTDPRLHDLFVRADDAQTPRRSKTQRLVVVRDPGEDEGPEDPEPSTPVLGWGLHGTGAARRTRFPALPSGIVLGGLVVVLAAASGALYFKKHGALRRAEASIEAGDLDRADRILESLGTFLVNKKRRRELLARLREERAAVAKTEGATQPAAPAAEAPPGPGNIPPPPAGPDPEPTAPPPDLPSEPVSDPSPAPEPDPAPPQDPRIGEALEAKGRGDLDAAVRLLRDASGECPGADQALAALRGELAGAAEDLLRRGEFDAAENHFEALIRWFPEGGFAPRLEEARFLPLLQRGEGLLGAGDFEGALEVFEEARGFGRDPRIEEGCTRAQVAVWTARGEGLERAGFWPQARYYFEKVRRLVGETEEVRAALARCAASETCAMALERMEALYRVRKFAGALVAATEALRTGADDGRAAKAVDYLQCLLEMEWIPPRPDAVRDGEDEFGGYFISRNEVTVGEYAAFLSAPEGKGREPAGWADQKGKANRSVVGVCFDDARAFAAWQGCRLPSVSQWERAARGAQPRSWPWGGAFEASRANTAEGGCGTVAEVGAFPDDVSPHGVFAMAGNVAEWTRDLAPSNGAHAEGSRIVCGGDFRHGAEEARTTARRAFGPGAREDYLGFRCVRETLRPTLLAK